MSTYLQEAFHAMELLEEETFKLGDANLKDLLDFTNQDELNDIIDVYDPEVVAQEDEVQDSYIGSIILECEVCHSPIFKAIEDVEIDEDTDLANIHDECPICHSQDGFKIIGQVAPYAEEPEIKVEVEEKPEVDELDIEEEPIEDEDDLEESLGEELDPELEARFEKVEAKLDDIMDEVQEVEDLEKEEQGLDIEENEEAGATDEEEAIDAEEPIEESLNEGILGAIGGAALGGGVLGGGLAGGLAGAAAGSIAQDALLKEDDSEYEFKDGNYVLKEGRISRYDQITNDLYGFTSSTRYVKPEGSEQTYDTKNILPVTSADGDELIRVFANSPEELQFAKKVANYYRAPISGVKTVKSKSALGSKAGKYYVDIIYDDELFEPQDGDIEIGESLREGFEKIDLEMEDKIIHVSEEEKEPIPDAEMIVPISDEVEAELKNSEEPEETPSDESNDLDDEEPFEDAEVPEEAGDMVDFDVNDFDENEFDDLGESYLKKVYENVESFKTTTVTQTENNLIVEGIIKFNSGKEKVTQFIFEAKDATNEGNVRFIGENTQITRGKKAFTLAGKITEGKFIAESLNYNYKAKDATGNSTRLYGTVKKKQ